MRTAQCFLCNARVGDKHLETTEHFRCNEEWEVGYIFWKLVEGLEFLHLHRILQRDLKDDNVRMANRHHFHGGILPSYVSVILLVADLIAPGLQRLDDPIDGQ